MKRNLEIWLPSWQIYPHHKNLHKNLLAPVAAISYNPSIRGQGLCFLSFHPFYFDQINFPSLLPLRLALCFSWNYKSSVNYSGSKMNTQRLLRLIHTINEIKANRRPLPRHAGLDPATSPARSGIPGFPLSKNDYELAPTLRRDVVKSEC